MNAKRKRTLIDPFLIEQITRFYQQEEVTPDAEEIDRGWAKVREQVKNQGAKSRHIRAIAIAILSSAAIFISVVWIGKSFLHVPSKPLTIVNPDILSVASGMDVAVDTVADIKLVTTGKEFVIHSGANVTYSAQGQIAIDNQRIAHKASATVADTVVSYDQILVPRGKHTYLTLSDGTVIHLNAGTRVIYPHTFASDKREIYVEGEAYLQVAHLTNHIPFVVRTNQFEVEVLGTSFNINAYRDDKQAEVVLLEGAIRLRDTKKQTTQLRPNQMVTLNDGEMKSKKQVNAEEYIAWTNSLLVLHGKPLDAICRKLSRYYGITIEVDSECATLPLQGKLDLTSSPAELMRRLSVVAPIRFQLIDDGQGYRIMKNE